MSDPKRKELIEAVEPALDPDPGDTEVDVGHSPPSPTTGSINTDTIDVDKVKPINENDTEDSSEGDSDAEMEDAKDGRNLDRDKEILNKLSLYMKDMNTDQLANVMSIVEMLNTVNTQKNYSKTHVDSAEENIKKSKNTKKTTKNDKKINIKSKKQKNKDNDNESSTSDDDTQNESESDNHTEDSDTDEDNCEKTKVSIIGDEITKVRNGLKRNERKHIDELIQSTIKKQTGYIEKLPEFKANYETEQKYVQYFEYLEAMYPGIIEAIEDESDNFDVSKIPYVFETLKKSTKKLLFGLLILAIYDAMTSKRFLGDEMDWGYGKFQTAVHRLLAEKPENMRMIIVEVLRFVNYLHLNGPLLNWPRMTTELGLQWDRLKTRHHKVIYYYLLLNQWYVKLYNESKKTHSENAMVNHILEYYEKDKKDKHMIEALGFLTKYKCKLLLFHDNEAELNAMQNKHSFDQIFQQEFPDPKPKAPKNGKKSNKDFNQKQSDKHPTKDENRQHNSRDNNKTDNLKVEHVNAIVDLQSIDEDPYILDSGSTISLVNDLSVLTNVQEGEPRLIRTVQGDATTMVLTTHGDLKLKAGTHEMIFKNVYYNPQLEFNIIALTSMQNYALVFKEHVCYAVNNQGHGFQIAVYDKDLKLYKLKISKRNFSCNPNTFPLLERPVTNQLPTETIAVIRNVTKSDRTRHNYERLICNPQSYSLMDVHLRANHLHPENMKRMIAEKKLKVHPSPSKNDYDEVKNCRICRIVNVVAQSHNNPLPKGHRPNEIVHCDQMGPIKVFGIKNYLTTIIDDFTGYFEVLVSPTKSVAEMVMDRLKIWHNRNNILIFHSDQGRELPSPESLLRLGIQKIVSTPYSPQQNGVAERYNRILLVAIRKVLMNLVDDEKVYAILPDIIEYAVHVENRIIRRFHKDDSRHGKTAYELYHNIERHDFHFQQFGVDCVVKFEDIAKMRLYGLNPEKLDSLTCDAVFIGYDDNSNVNYKVILMNGGFQKCTTNNIRFLDTANNLPTVLNHMVKIDPNSVPFTKDVFEILENQAYIIPTTEETPELITIPVDHSLTRKHQDFNEIESLNSTMIHLEEDQGSDTSPTMDRHSSPDLSMDEDEEAIETDSHSTINDPIVIPDDSQSDTVTHTDADITELNHSSIVINDESDDVHETHNDADIDDHTHTTITITNASEGDHDTHDDAGTEEITRINSLITGQISSDTSDASDITSDESDLTTATTTELIEPVISSDITSDASDLNPATTTELIEPVTTSELGGAMNNSGQSSNGETVSKQLNDTDTDDNTTTEIINNQQPEISHNPKISKTIKRKRSLSPSPEHEDTQLTWMSHGIGDLNIRRLRSGRKVVTSQTITDQVNLIMEHIDFNNEHWKKAMQKEIDNFKSMDVFETVKCPKGVRPITSRWVHTYKKDDLKGDVYKSRCVIHGFKQVLDEHYDKYRVSSPVVDLSTIRLITTIANEFQWEIHHYDVSHAYLNAPIDFPNIYVKPPKGYDIAEGQCWLIKKSVYGMKQAGYNWYHYLRTKLIELGFKADDLLDGLFVRTKTKNEKIIIALYVDDLFVTGSSHEAIQKVYQELSKLITLKSFNEVTEYLGIQFERNNGDIMLHQTKYLQSIMDDFEIDKKHNQHTPYRIEKPKHINIDGDFYEVEEDEPLNAQQKTRFQQGVGSLLWAANNTRPDISFTVGKLGSVASKPTIADYNKMIQCMGYVNRHMNQKITISKNRFHHKTGQFFIEVYCDASFAEGVDARLISGYLIYVNGNLVRWKSKKQTVVATSTAESELVALRDAVQDALEIRQMILDLGYNIANMTVFEDNKAAIAKCLNPKVNHGRKSIDVLMKFIREKITTRYFNIEYINTAINIADLLTKAHPRVSHNKLLNLLYDRLDLSTDIN